MKVLFFGDIVGRVGRRALASVLPDLKAKYQPDAIIANVENLAHGKGVTVKTLIEVKELGIDGFTSGNHVWKKEEVVAAAAASGVLLATPLNDPRTPDGHGYIKLNVAGLELLVVNLLGRIFMKETDLTCPFRAMDYLLAANASFKGPIILDFHAEATSEKVALGWYLNGRVGAVLGTHTHVPTADYKLLPQGTAYVTDLGMVGPADSVLGVTKELIIAKFLTNGPIIFDYPEDGPAEVNAVLLEFDASNKAVRLEKINQLVQT